MVRANYLTISSVDPDSIAGEIGMEKGDKLLRINNNPVWDIIDYHMLTCEAALNLEILKHSGETWIVEINKGEYEPLGLDFYEDIPGGIRQCCNKCLFCFVDQLPSGLRDTLYVKDDDYRHSFLYGNYVSLTNLSREDWERIMRMRLSPLYVSVHSTNPRLRTRLFGNSGAGRIMEQLRELGNAGITMHTQVVVCPGINDGGELDSTLHDLASLWPAVASVSVVPVGVTKYQKYEHPFFPVDRITAYDIVARVERLQSEFLKIFGYRLVFAADELYLTAGLDIPGEEYYEDFPQIENGVGMVRLFMEDLSAFLEELPPKVNPRKTVIISGVLAAEIISQAARQISEAVKGAEPSVLPVKNAFFGPTVTVTGLLTGQDIAAAIEEHFYGRKETDSIVLLPDVALKADADVFLDGYSVEDVARRTGRRLLVVENNARGLIKGTLGLEVL